MYWSDKANQTEEKNYFWQKNSADLEITSYVLLSKLNDLKNEDITKAIQIAKWINSQRNSLGGFYSTQVNLAS